jgi:hypothetical protein
MDLADKKTTHLAVSDAMTLSISTFSLMTLNIMGITVTLSFTTLCNEWHYTECRVLFAIVPLG